MKDSSPILIIDSNYIAHAARFSMGDLSHDDIPTGVVFGFLVRVLNLAQFFKTNDLVFIWDSKFSERKKIYAEYKKKKPLEKEELKTLMLALKQFTKLRREILPEIGFKNVHVQKGREADDVIAAITRHDQLSNLIIVTADQDLYQLLYPNVAIWNPAKKEMVTQRKFKKRFDCEVNQWAEVKATAGCTSDNVKGIQGVGIPTAIKYLNGELKDTTKAFANIKSKEGRSIIKRNRILVTLPWKKTKVPQHNQNKFSLEGFIDVCLQYGLESLITQEVLLEWKNMMNGKFRRRK